MDENPHFEHFYHNLAVFATVITAVHVSWTYDNSNDSLAGWLASTAPTLLTGIMLFGFLICAACYVSDTQFFSLSTTNAESGHTPETFRTSSDPAREDRHLFYVQVLAFAPGFGITIDLVWRWYLVCRHLLGNIDEWDEPGGLLLSLTILMMLLPLGALLLLTWIPMWYLLDARRSLDEESCTKGFEDRKAGSRAKLKTVVVAAEAYGKDLESQTERSHSKVKATGEFLGVLRNWQTSDHATGENLLL